MNQGRILVVDDDPLMVNLLQATLRADGYAVLAARDGVEGLASVREERPDLVISDVMMPRMDGFELVSKLRADSLIGETPLIILSAKGEEEDIVKGLGVGADDYVSKPFRRRELLARVKSILTRRRACLTRTAPPPEGPFAGAALDHLAALTFDTFVVGPGNRSAFEAARGAAENPGLRFNPLFLYGGPGLGKTHLMASLANHVFAQNASIRALYLTSEVFSQQILEAYHNRTVDALKRDYLLSDIMLIDDVQFLGISPSLQSVAADMLAVMYDQGKQIVVSSDRRPEELSTLVEEMSKAFAFGLVVEIDRPDSTLRARILRFKAEQNAWPLQPDLLDYLANRLDSDIRTLEGVAKRMVALKTLSGVTLTPEVVDELITHVTGGAPPVPVSAPMVPVAVARESAEPERELWEGPEPVSRLPDPLVQEFARTTEVIRISGSLDEVAWSVPLAPATPVVVMGTSRALVVDTVEALGGQRQPRPSLPEGERWAHMVHIADESPAWLLVGRGKPDDQDPLSVALSALNPPLFLVVLDSRSPSIMASRELISSVPNDAGQAVVVLTGVDREQGERDSEALSRSLRRLFRVADHVPLVVRDAVNAVEARAWLKLARGATLGPRPERAEPGPETPPPM